MNTASSATKVPKAAWSRSAIVFANAISRAFTAAPSAPPAQLDALTGGALDREAVLVEVKARTAKGCEGQPLLPGVESVLREARALGLGRAVASSSSRGWGGGG